MVSGSVVVRTKSLVVFVLAMLAFGAAGCNESEIESLILRANAELGIRVSVTTTNDDHCMKEQIKTWLNTYKNMPSERREEFKRNLKSKYDVLALRETHAVGWINGDQVVLHWEHNTKKLFDTRRRRGDTPRTEINADSARQLTVRLQATLDQTLYAHYRTDFTLVYNSLRAGDAEGFFKARDDQSIRLTHQQNGWKPYCSPLLPLDELTDPRPADEDSDEDHDQNRQPGAEYDNGHNHYDHDKTQREPRVSQS